MLNKRREGFTLIELLIVVVIIGILAAIAIPKFSSTREKAFVSSMKSDLRNLQSAQEMYYASAASDYTYLNTGSATSATPFEDLDNFTPSQSVTITLAANGTPAEGWLATATHTGVPDYTCEVFVGGESNAGNIAPGPGVVACDDDPEEQN